MPQAIHASTSRRALMGIAAVLPLALAPAALASVNPDADLIHLGAERTRLKALRDQAGVVHDATRAAYEAAKPHPPEILRKTYFDYGAVNRIESRRGYYSGADIEVIRASLADHRKTMAENNGLNTGFARRCEAILAAHEEYEPRRRAAYEAAGCEAANDAWELAYERLGAVEDRIIAARAVTHDGLAVKARLAIDHMRTFEANCEDDDYDIQILRSLFVDLGVA
jgi:hypothetical protein